MAIGTPASIGTSTSLVAGSSKTITTSAAIVAGDLVVVSISYYNGGASPVAITSVSDGTNTYTAAFTSSATGSTPSTIALYYCANASAVASSSTITITFGSNISGGAFAAARVTGVATASALDKTATDNTVTSTPTVSTGVLTSADQVIFDVVGGYNYTGYTEDANFTNLAAQFPGQVAGTLGHRIVSSTSSVSCSPTLTVGAGATYTEIGVASFIAAATATTSHFLTMLGVGQ